MSSTSAATIEIRFASEAGRTQFPVFCNSIISLEAPRTGSFPNLSSKPGPDGGMDGQWDLTSAAEGVTSPFTRKGWNVYQFKALDVVALGRPKAFAELCKRCDGAIADMIGRLEKPDTPALFVLFTNLQLGIERESATASEAILNQQTGKLRQALLKNCPSSIELAIIDAGRLEGLVARSPILQRVWFESVGASWSDASKREANIWKIIGPLIGRDADRKQVEAWLADDDVRIVTLTGLSGIGKTRLALEGTRSLEPVVFMIDDVSALIRDGLSSLTATPDQIVLLVDDPTSKDADSLARQALGSEKPIKLIMTIPSQRAIPATAFGDTKRVKSWHVQPLSGESPRQLLDSLNGQFDNRARDWILQQAGGNPGIIVAAARLGPNLRSSAKTLREEISRGLQLKLSAGADRELITIAAILSPLVYVRLQPADEIHVLSNAIEPAISATSVVRRLPELEGFGVARRRAATAAIAPPVFAAGLFTELIDANASLPTVLFQRLDHSGKLRLLERLVTLELPSNADFWRSLLGSTEDVMPGHLQEHLEILEYLARAAPNVVANFLQHGLDRLLMVAKSGNRDLHQRIGDVVGELLEEQDTGPVAFDMLTRIVLDEEAAAEKQGVALMFCECFVQWYPRPFSYAQREQSLETLLSSPHVAVRLLAVKAITMATAVPDTLSGRAVLARRLGPAPNYGTMGEVWGFTRRMMLRRLQLCQSEDKDIAEAAQHDLPKTLAPLYHHLPIENALELFREVMKLHCDRCIKIDVRDLWGQLTWIRDRYREHSTKPEYAQRKIDLNKAADELDGWIALLTSGSFVNRLNLAMGQNFEFEEIEFEGKTIHGFELRVILLAREAAADPDLMSNAAWEQLAGDRGLNSNTFARELGRTDKNRTLYDAFETRADNWQWAQMLASYLDGAREADAKWAEGRLGAMPSERGKSNIALLVAARNILPSTTGRERLQQLIAGHHIAPFDVAVAFSCGRWLEQIPPNEVRAIFEYVHSDPQQAANLANVMSLYLHHQKPLPRELIPIAQETLKEVRNISDGGGNNSYHCDQIAIGIARTDSEAGFALLQSCADRIADRDHWRFGSGWDPFDWPGSRDFWEFLRERDPERVYEILSSIQRKHRWPDFRQARNRQLLDLERHADIIRTIVEKRGTSAAEIFADCAVCSQSGFLEFATHLLTLYPGNERIRGSLNSAVIEKTGFGSEFNHLSDAETFVRQHLADESLAPNAKRWLQQLETLIQAKRVEARKFLDTEPPYWPN